jgi:predicted nuclease of restriction endonuclease-like (RecB) superfamily
LTIREKYDEKELKNALMDKVENFLMELGTGFAFMGREVRLEVGNKEKYLDMLFYNTRQHCYVVVEVKAVERRVFPVRRSALLSLFVSASCLRTGFSTDSPGLH